MEELHRQPNIENSKLLALSEVENGLCLCSNSLFSISTSLGGSHQLNHGEVSGSLKLADILGRIHARLIDEGYTLNNGLITKP